ncbi:MAG: biosynthetic-type acetolactate synthase large subunit [Candidatus Methanomethylophilus sp.]|nr:biosynthetic-type acetolactate synthase large subunit [Methanomethylophilus sp.]MDD3233059.1 biosynthetic-type acetolactate synthase large subunit [Methanomethylophilus sp.]MDD4222230.1 biosynthetic-type acetolactate synthase large subunit [Methanomethylophilus sp.]MDD4668891.1 biosynthetic-type acetolactate synthase large subunit [Methanomethylophilus sp.]
MRGSKALLKMLEDRGVQNIFGYPGATVIPVYDAFLDSNIRHVLVRHEQCAAHMADGYARVTGIPGVCLSTSGPGATNLVTGIATAYADSVPMIAMTGQVGTGALGAGAFQEVDAYSLMMPVTKHNFRVLDPERLPHALAEGWEICQTGRPGPVHIDLPVDQINADIPDDLLKKKWGIKYPIEDTSGIPLAAKWLKAAVRPVMLVGGGVVRSGAWAETLKLAELLHIPMITTLMGLGAVPSEHPLNLGPLGMHGRLGALDAFSGADLILAVGTKFSDRTYSPHTEPSNDCRIIQIDIDSTEFGKAKRQSVNICCDAKKGVRMLTDAVSGYQNNHQQWDTAVVALRKRCQCSFDRNEVPIKPQKVMCELNKILARDDTYLTTDVGQNQMWCMHCLDIRRPRQFITTGSFGTMGFGLPSALGVKIAKPDAKVLTVVGDGGLQMVIQELATSVAEDLPVTVVLLDNGWLGMVRQWQKLFWNKRYSGTKLAADPDFVKIAEAYGATGIHVDKPGEVADALKQAMESDRTCIVQIKVDPEEDITPMVLADPKIPIIKGSCPY